MFRKILFWTHLLTGLTGGLVILLMSITGVLLTYEKQIIAWADRRDAAVTSSGSASSSYDVEHLLTAATLSGSTSPNSLEGQVPASVTLRSGTAEPVALAFREGTFLADPSTGRILAPQNASVRAFFRSVTDWHRWLGVSAADGPDARQNARIITGASNLGFLFLVVSGLYLWFPRKWRWQNLRAVLWFRGGLNAKARDFNWHNVTGFWACVPLFVVVLSGVVMSYPWANNLVYTMNGVQPPPPRAKGKGDKAEKGKLEQGNKGRSGKARTFEAREKNSAPRVIAGNTEFGEPAERKPAISIAGLNQLLASVQSQHPDWRTISFSLPKDDQAPVVFNIDEGNGGQPQLRSTVTIARATGQVVKQDVFSDQDAGRRARSWMRSAHTGEYYGFIGQTVAGVASAAGVLLVWTGLALAWRRFRAWMARDRSSVAESTRQMAA